MKPTTRSSGVVLIVTLCFLVLISASIVAFLTRVQLRTKVSFNSVSEKKAELLAASAVDLLTNELYSEIASPAKSIIYDSTGVAVDNPATATPPLIFEPKVRPGFSPGLYAVPERRGEAVGDLSGGITPGFENLIKHSYPTTVSNDPPLDYDDPNGPDEDVAPYLLYTGASAKPMIAEGPNASTAMRSLNGRFIPDESWNAPRLMPAGTTFHNNWCVITRSGVKSLKDADVQLSATDPDSIKNPNGQSYAIGRFAFAIYDVGGLMDINVAGNGLVTPSSPPSDRAINANRAYLNQVDLNSLLASAPSDTTDRLGPLLLWRNPETKTDEEVLFSTKESFLSPRFGEQHFTNRRDLLRFAEANPSIIADSKLPLLTIFSRTLTTPSWFPARNATELAPNVLTSAASLVHRDYLMMHPDYFKYYDNRNLADVKPTDSPSPSQPNPNRSIPNIRNPSETTITSYHDDGTTFQWTLKEGEPLLQRRFPLARLKWLGIDGPEMSAFASSLSSTDAQTAIRACFGLRWNATEKRWDYVGSNLGDSSTRILGAIATLDQVAKEGREPNFLELLQAGILKGSLGVPETLNTSGSGSTRTFKIKMTHVAEIAANIIDQYDTDNYPTIVCVEALQDIAGNTTLKYAHLAIGSENLPLIAKIAVTGYRPVSDRANISGWTEFEMWNPYQAPGASGPGTSGPTSFRIRLVDGQITTGYKLTGSSLYVPATESIATYQRPRTLVVSVPDRDTMSNRLASDTPINLDTLRADRNGLGTIVTSPGSPEGLFNEPSTGASYTGFYTGFIEFPEPGLTLVYEQKFTNAGFLLEYQYPGGEWRPVQKIFSGGLDEDSITGLLVQGSANGGRIGTSNFPAAEVVGPNGRFTVPNARFGYLATLDPRTIRFGVGRSMGVSRIARDTSFFPSLNSSTWKLLTGTITTGTNGPGPSDFVLPAPNTQGAPYDTSLRSYRFADNRGTGATRMGTGLTADFVIDPRYADSDGVQRFGDGIFNTHYRDSSRNPATPDTQYGVFPMLPLSQGRSQDRPVMLNRPFKNVGELGYVFRGLPFRSLDFATARSGDAALLDLFCINHGDEESAMVAGCIDLNTRQSEVLQAVLRGATRTPFTPESNQLSAGDAELIGDRLVALSSSRSNPKEGPFLNPAELTRVVADDIPNSLLSSSAMPNGLKGHREAAVRALSGIGQTRTWNLMLDVVAQSGKYPPSASNLANFTVEGECRYWVHLAIDRYTGKVIDQVWERVDNN